jgi:hypothetical protein
LKVLQICKKSPLPPKDGESIAIHQVSKTFVNMGCELDVLTILTAKHPFFDTSMQLPGVDYLAVWLDTDFKILPALWNTFEKVPYLIKRFYHKDFEIKLQYLLQQNHYDFIWLEGVFLAPYLSLIRKFSGARVILRAHNVEYLIWQRHALEEQSIGKKLYLNYFLVSKLAQYEQELASKFDAIVSISPVDNQFFVLHKAKNTLVLPLALTLPEPSVLPINFSVGFIGGMDWLPNQLGVTWFLENVWTKFSEKHPEVIFHLAGRNFPKEWLLKKIPQVKIWGEVEDAALFIQNPKCNDCTHF